MRTEQVGRGNDPIRIRRSVMKRSLKALDHSVETPLQRAAANRATSGKKIALSISEADAPERVGRFPDHLDAALLEHLHSAKYTTALGNRVLGKR
jgi:hypothetical protein